MKRKEQWINQTLDSLDGIEVVSCPEGISDRILLKMNQPEQKNITLKPSLVWRVAATVLILITLNIVTGLFNRQEVNESGNAGVTNSVYLSYLTPYNF